MRDIGRGQDGRARGAARLDPPEVDIGGRDQAEGTVMVLGVVPGKEDVAMGSRVLDRTEPVRKFWAVLEGLELGFRERVVVRHVRPGVLVTPKSASRKATDFEVMAVGGRRGT